MSSATRRLDAVIDRYVGDKIVGTNVIFSLGGEVVYARAAGFLDREGGRVMAPRTLFRLSSVTKPYVAVTALTLMEAGRLKLDAAVTDYLPTFRPRLADGRAPTITIAQLLTHTSGLTYDLGLTVPLDQPPSGGIDRSHLTLAENIDRIANVPLAFAPGTGWAYSLAIDVLGGVLEAIEGKSLPSIVAERVLAPLGLGDTGFWPADPTRLSVAYADGTPPHPMADPERIFNPDGSSIVFSPSRAFDRNAFPSGGAGMVGSAEDFFTFIETLRRGGAPLLSPATMPLLTDSHTAGLDTGMPGYGFSHGWSVIEDPVAAATTMSAGGWNWGGVYGHQWYVDPARQATLLVFSNTAVEGCTGRYPLDVRDAAFAA